MQMAFDEIESNPEVKEFFELVNKFDDRTVAAAQHFAKSWFPNKTFNSDMIRASFIPSVRASPKYAPLMKLKVLMRDDEPDLLVYKGKKQSSVDQVVPNARIQAIIAPKSLWFVGAQFGTSWNVLQVKVVESANKLTSYAFIDKNGQGGVEEEEEKEKEKEKELTIDDTFPPSTREALLAQSQAKQAETIKSSKPNLFIASQLPSKPTTQFGSQQKPPQSTTSSTPPQSQQSLSRPQFQFTNQTGVFKPTPTTSTQQPTQPQAQAQASKTTRAFTSKDTEKKEKTKPNRSSYLGFGEN